MTLNGWPGFSALLTLFADQGFTDMSQGSPNLYFAAARDSFFLTAVPG